MSENCLHLQHLGACRSALPGSAEACGRVLLVGEVNPISARPEHALFCAPAGCSGHRLQEVILALPRVHYLALWRTNLCRGDWSTTLARGRAAQLVDGGAPWDVIVMLGKQVASAFAPLVGLSGAARMPDVSRVARAGRGTDLTLASIGHPSGLNRRWNEPGAVERARDLMRSLAPEIPWGTA